MKNILYGDGVHDDAPAIQEMLDSGIAEVNLPIPEKHYCIGATLKIHGGQTLKMSPFTTVKLMADVNAAMLENADFTVYSENICVDGGIWDMNSIEQEPNPGHFPGKDGLIIRERMEKLGYRRVNTSYPELTVPWPLYTGFCMRFCRIKNFTLKNVTYKNPVTYAVQMSYTENFTVRDITFDYRVGAPKLWNMDGVHIEGHCKNGYIGNLKGACHDDTVALTADDGVYGPIENIVIDGIFAEHAHSAVRLLSHGLKVENVRISNVFGSFYTYCIGMTKYHGPEEERGYMRNIVIDNISASASEGTKDVEGGNYPFIWVEKGLDIEDLFISNVNRIEETYPTPMIKIDEGARVDNFVLTNLKQVSKLGAPIEQIVIDGVAENMITSNIINK